MIEFLKGADRSLFLLLNSWHADFLNPLMIFFSGQIIWLPLVLLSLYLAFKKFDARTAWIFFLFLTLAIIASDVTSSYVLKNLTSRFRPCKDPELKHLIYQFGQRCGGRFGFVSSHAANSFAIVGFSLMTLRLNRVFHLLWLVPAIVSYSRIYLGVHFPGDILGGSLVGLIWAAMFGWGFNQSYGASR